MFTQETSTTLVNTIKWEACGGAVLIKDMETNHLHNALRKLNGHCDCNDYAGFTVAQWKKLFNFELDRRKDTEMELKIKAEAAKEAYKLAKVNAQYALIAYNEAAKEAYTACENAGYCAHYLYKAVGVSAQALETIRGY